MKFTGHADYKPLKPYIDIAEKAKTDAMDLMEKALENRKTHPFLNEFRQFYPEMPLNLENFTHICIK